MTTPPESVRAFLACEIPEAVRGEILKWIRSSGARVRGVRWAGADQMHLTLRFLGNVSTETLAQVEERARAVAAAGRTCELEARGIGVFASLSRPRVVWVGFHGDLEPLLSLQRTLEAALQGLEIHQESAARGFHPHLTIGRIRDPRHVVGLESFFANGRDKFFGKVSVAELILFKSTLTSAGAKYNVLASFPLGGERRRQ